MSYSSIAKAITNDNCLEQYEFICSAEKSLAIQVSYIKKAIQKVYEDSHPDLLSHYHTILASQKKVESEAEMRREYLETCTNLLYKYECNEANKEFELQCSQLKHGMIVEIENEMEILRKYRETDESVACSNVTRSVPTRKTRSSRSKGKEELFENGKNDSLCNNLVLPSVEKPNRIANVKKSGFNVPTLEKKLAQSEVDSDLRELSAILEHYAKHPIKCAEEYVFAKMYRGKLLYKEMIVQEKDQIAVWDTTNDSAYFGVLSSVDWNDVSVCDQSGREHILNLQQLRTSSVRLEIVTIDNQSKLIHDVMRYVKKPLCDSEGQGNGLDDSDSRK